MLQALYEKHKAEVTPIEGFTSAWAYKI
jgi:hypothetical protein